MINANTCDLFQKVPFEMLDRLFRHSNAGAELDYTFLGFEDIYREVLNIVPKDYVVIDLGCAYAVQSWYFKDYAAYIGVDYGTSNKEKPTYEDNLAGVLQTNNSTFYFQSIQSFVSDVLPTLGLDTSKVFAVCSAVPDKEARRVVADTFANYLVWYPGLEKEMCLQYKKIKELKEDEFDILS